ncbi:hypothetical protein MIB92_12860 [Aestuariirhabdus sp. Z084]|uniref:hypothetical protein n=1 Tax=Aestuariirhabdus haliotis TaxID=2918751 RepID=UPI00201B413E|nr:hypothetical protein [Aestuariirhabdus haliotis]MCL6416543.1 hypothetical protein [Aestuariirhabdus haliotis]MCL6420533.1 hypothetical protein [Aestuariirhabdus haliotis]
MKLTNFLEFDAFNQLREQIGTRRLGYFELFDPHFHLTGDERIHLEQEGFLVNPAQVQRLVDGTFAYKNSRVICYLAQPSSQQLQAKPLCYHLTDCDDLLADLNSLESNTKILRVTTACSGVFPVRIENEIELRQLGVCEGCLQKLGFEGFDVQRNRRRAWSLQLLEAFSPEGFFARYRQYPVKPEEFAGRTAVVGHREGDALGNERQSHESASSDRHTNINWWEIRRKSALSE